MFALGLLIQPRVEWAAFVRGRRSASIYRMDRELAAFDALKIMDARAVLRLDAAPTRRGLLDGVSFVGWATIGVTLWLGPLLVAAAVWRATR